ncbi:MAG: winged helix DNA-binding domain-containing protein [Thermoplasmata archaeon]|nr:winged helix DNA-binding domain-containing protein [Thermoplasmata archaeon]
MPKTRRKISAGSNAPEISPDQVASFRLQRHHLAKRAPSRDLLSVVADMGGAQAQLLPAAYLSLWARVRDMDPMALDRALWQERSLAKAWCMRRTLHLLPSRQLAVFVRGSARCAEKEIRWVRNKGISAAALERLLEAALSALDRPQTRFELAGSVSRSTGLAKGTHLGGGWGNHRPQLGVRLDGLTIPASYLLHLLGARAVLCSGPSRGGEATFVRADAWVPRWRDVSQERAEVELLQRYIRAFGPVTIEDFVAWSRMRTTDAREIWAKTESQLTPVTIGGHTAWILRGDRARIADQGSLRSNVRLLPYFDSFILGHADRGHLLDASDHRRVYRNQGWVAPVVLVGGRIRALWNHRLNAKTLVLDVRPLEPLSDEVVAEIRAQVEDLGRFFGTEQVTTRIR